MPRFFPRPGRTTPFPRWSRTKRAGKPPPLQSRHPRTPGLPTRHRRALQPSCGPTRSTRRPVPSTTELFPSLPNHLPFLKPRSEEPGCSKEAPRRSTARWKALRTARPAVPSIPCWLNPGMPMSLTSDRSTAASGRPPTPLPPLRRGRPSPTHSRQTRSALWSSIRPTRPIKRSWPASPGRAPSAWSAVC